jgi:hypothetical protein
MQALIRPATWRYQSRRMNVEQSDVGIGLHLCAGDPQVTVILFIATLPT